MAYLEAERAYWEAFEQAEDDAAREALAHPSAAFLPRFLDYARRQKGRDVTIEAWTHVLSCADREGAAAEEARRALVRDHVASPALVAALWELGDDEAALRAVLAGSPHRSVRGPAQLLLGVLLKERGDDGARAELETALREYADVEAWGERVGDKAAAEIFELEHLQPGKPAPDIDGRDEKGVRFRLSDYRGKVVLLDFWGDW